MNSTKLRKRTELMARRACFAFWMITISKRAKAWMLPIHLTRDGL